MVAVIGGRNRTIGPWSDLRVIALITWDDGQGCQPEALLFQSEAMTKHGWLWLLLTASVLTLYWCLARNWRLGVSTPKAKRYSCVTSPSCVALLQRFFASHCFSTRLLLLLHRYLVYELCFKGSILSLICVACWGKISQEVVWPQSLAANLKII